MVSIIVPVYRAERCLRACVDSLLAQAYRDIEIILVDDGSPDGSGALCEAYAVQDARVRVIHKPNGGVSTARNAGIEAARGKYILFVDSDDYVEADYALRMVEAQKAKGEQTHIWCAIQTVTGYGHENAQCGIPAREPELHFSRQQIMTLHKMWLDTSPCNKLYHTELLREKGIRYQEGLSLGEDLLMNMAYLDAVGDAPICVITKPLYNYVRAGEESLDNGYRKDMLEIYQHINGEMEKLLVRWGVSPEQMALFYDSCFYSYEKVMRNTHRAPNVDARAADRFNSELMRSADFKRIYDKRTCFIHPLYKAAYGLGSYRMIRLLDWAYSLKQSIRR